MLHEIKHKFDLYFDTTLSVTNQVINNPKTAPIAAAYGISVGLVEINNAIQTVSVLVGLLVGGASLWVLIEKRVYDRRKRKEESKIREMKFKKLSLEKDSLENHIRKQKKG